MDGTTAAWAELWKSASWYARFNVVEGVLWMAVAAVVALRTPAADSRQRWAARCGVLALAAFGATDWLECRYEAIIPLWLWAMKIACGGAILAARYTWLGWRRFRFQEREVMFAVFCLVCVAGLIWLQRLAAGGT
jgi:hypothetical protein